MYDPTGAGWIKHTMYGTSRLLQLLGPKACRSGEARNFFLEVRVFEVSRAVLFSESSFLVTPPWLALINHLRCESEIVHPKEALLDVMSHCADLCSRALEVTESLCSQNLTVQDICKLDALAIEGLGMRVALSQIEETILLWKCSLREDYQLIVAWVYHAAISIYLSGIYDYGSIWRKNHVVTPVLCKFDICRHVDTIISLSIWALENSNLSGLLFLCPLRIAGARAWTCEQKLRIGKALMLIGRSFKVVEVFSFELGL